MVRRKCNLSNGKGSEQWYSQFPGSNCPSDGVRLGETVEWIGEDKSQLVLKRRDTPVCRRFKKTVGGLIDVVEDLFEAIEACFPPAQDMVVGKEGRF